MSRIEKDFLAEECGLDDSCFADDMDICKFDFWLKENEENLLIKFSETGADRELDFDLEKAFEEEFKQYRKDKK